MDLSPEDGENGQNVFLYEKWSFTVTQKSCFSTKLTIHTHVDLRESSQYGFFCEKRMWPNIAKVAVGKPLLAHFQNIFFLLVSVMESPFLGKKARSF